MGRPPRHLVVGERGVILLEPPRARQYRSFLAVEQPGEQKKSTLVLEVNKPLKLAGWRLYQSGYDEKAGRDSEVSVIEAVRDPWLPVVYAGIFMLIAGSLRLLSQRSLFLKAGEG